MKKYIISLLPVHLSLLILLCSCDNAKDYSDITFRNYLAYEINRSESFLETQVEGIAEGEYKAGSKQAYLDVIEKSRITLDDESSDQNRIDLAFSDLVQAGEDFYDQMNPFASRFQDLIEYADFTISHTEEGSDEGFVKPGSREILQSAIDRAKSVISDPSLVQRKIDTETPLLLNAIYSFDGNITGKGAVYIENPGFEDPGYTTADFHEVAGWETFGVLETWAPKAEIHQGGSPLVPLDSLPEGRFVLKIGSYTQGVYQQLSERIHPEVSYTVGMMVSLLQNNPDAFGKRHKVVFRTRIISFREAVGDYESFDIVSEFYDTLGIAVTGFKNIEHTFNSGTSSGFSGATLTIDFTAKHSFDPANPIWAECYIAADSLYIFRK